MTKKIIVFALVALISAGALFAAPLMGAPAATVNLVRNKAITQAEVDELVKEAKAAGINAIPSKVLDSLIDEEVLRQGAERDGVKVTANEVEQQVRIVMQNIQAQIGQALTDEQFAEFVKGQTGMDMDEYREALGEQLLAQKYLQTKRGAKMQAEAAALEIPQKKVEDFYRKNRQQFFAAENVKLSHIFIPFTGDEAVDAENGALLADVAEQIKTGKITFEKAVQEYSQDPGSKDIAGDIGWLTMDDQNARLGLGDAFIDGAMNLRAGETSGLIESKQGYHIVKVSVHNDGKLLGLHDRINPVDKLTVYQYIEGLLKQQASQEIINRNLNELIAELRGQAKIRIY